MTGHFRRDLIVESVGKQAPNVCVAASMASADRHVEAGVQALDKFAQILRRMLSVGVQEGDQFAGRDARSRLDCCSVAEAYRMAQDRGASPFS